MVSHAPTNRHVQVVEPKSSNRERPPLDFAAGAPSLSVHELGLSDPSPRDQLEDEYNNRDDEQEMDQSATELKTKPEKP